MPPSNYYNWFCVANSVARIANDVAAIKAAQLGYVSSRPQPSRKSDDGGKEQLKAKSQEPREEAPTSSRPIIQPDIINAPSEKTLSQLSDPPSPLRRATATPIESPKLPFDALVVPEPHRGPPLGTSAVPSSKIARLFHYGGTYVSYITPSNLMN